MSCSLGFVSGLVDFIYRYRIYYILSINKESKCQSCVPPSHKKVR